MGSQSMLQTATPPSSTNNNSNTSEEKKDESERKKKKSKKKLQWHDGNICTDACCDRETLPLFCESVFCAPALFGLVSYNASLALQAKADPIAFHDIWKDQEKYESRYCSIYCFFHSLALPAVACVPCMNFITVYCTRDAVKTSLQMEADGSNKNPDDIFFGLLFHWFCCKDVFNNPVDDKWADDNFCPMCIPPTILYLVACFPLSIPFHLTQMQKEFEHREMSIGTCCRPRSREPEPHTWRSRKYVFLIAEKAKTRMKEIGEVYTVLFVTAKYVPPKKDAYDEEEEGVDLDAVDDRKDETKSLLNQQGSNTPPSPKTMS